MRISNRIILATSLCAAMLMTTFDISRASDEPPTPAPVEQTQVPEVEEPAVPSLVPAAGEGEQSATPVDPPSTTPKNDSHSGTSKPPKKPTAAVGEIRGIIQGLPGKDEVRLELRRRQDKSLVPVASATTAGQGEFVFRGVSTGEYVITPDLSTLPEGYGLYQRHVFTVVSGTLRTVEFQVGKIHELTISAGPELVVGENEPFFVETTAFDAKGDYLFAASQVIDPEEETATKRSVNGAGFVFKGKGKVRVIRARNGQHVAELTVHVKGNGGPAEDAPAQADSAEADSAEANP